MRKFRSNTIKHDLPLFDRRINGLHYELSGEYDLVQLIVATGKQITKQITTRTLNEQKYGSAFVGAVQKIHTR